SQQYSPAAILGDLVHKGLESLNLLSNFEIQSEVETAKIIDLKDRKINVKGRVDILLKNKNNEIIIVEIKTARKDIGLPLQHHILQLRIYLWLFNTKNGILIYITPDRLSEYEVKEPATDDEIRMLLSELLSASKAPKYIWECKYCEYNIVCPNKKT
ncbi:MAG: CRISPR-associated protein Cas4, partial [Sulfolobus sp.]|nr:CRISPR-associated protein Cas4 [Sulfolobus sp.]